MNEHPPYQPPQHQPYPNVTQQVYVMSPARTSGAAVLSLVCGIIGLLGFHICGAFLVGIISGHVALSTIKHSGGRIVGRGIALAGLFLNYLPVIVALIIGIIFLFIWILAALGIAVGSAR
jgi:hypothetical protein